MSRELADLQNRAHTLAYYLDGVEGPAQLNWDKVMSLIHALNEAYVSATPLDREGLSLVVE